MYVIFNILLPCNCLMAVFKPNPHPLLLLPGDIVESSARELEPEVNKNQEERSFQLLTT